MHCNLVKLRVIVRSVLDRDLHNVLVGTILEQKEAEAHRSGTILKCFEPEANVGDRCQRSFFGMFQTPGD